MDFDHVFDHLEIETNPFAVCELHGVCDLGMGHDTNASLHYVLVGEGALMLQDAGSIPVAPGTLVLVPALQNHAMRSFGGAGNSSLSCDPPELKLLHLLKSGNADNGGRMIALCAHIQIGLRGAVDVIDLVRQPIFEQIASDSPLQSVLQQFLHELSHPTLGSRAMIRVLLTQCVIELLRRKLSNADASLRWMAALRDPSVWEALRVMLDEPGFPHTVESLANSVGMSRSAFAQRFTAAYGSGPIELLRELRMRKAASLLRDSDLPVKRVAQLVGFNSRTAFSRVFEQRIGQNPTDFRRDTL